MTGQLAEKNPDLVVSSPSASAGLGKKRARMDEPNGSRSSAKRGKPKGDLRSVRTYLDKNAPEPEFLRIMGEEAERNGTSKLTLRQINQIIQKARAEKKQA